MLYPSDYGYAVGGDIRKQCLSTKLFEYNLGNCKESLWLYKEKDIWLISPFSGNSYASFCVDSAGHVRYCSATESHSIWPTIYLKSTVKILPNSKPDQEYGSKDNPFVLQ